MTNYLKTLPILFALLGCNQAEMKDSDTADTFDAKPQIAVDGATISNVSSLDQIRIYLSECDPPKTCRSVIIEEGGQIWIQAAFETEGYRLTARLGPTGFILASRKENPANELFTKKEMVEVMATYGVDVDLPFVQWVEVDPSEI